MAIRTVGSNSDFPSILAAMQVSGPGDTIRLEAGYSNETAVVAFSGMTIFGALNSVGIVLRLHTGVATVTLTGTAPIRVLDAGDGNGIVGNAGNNVITVTGGIDAVNGGLGVDRLIVDYRAATGAVTGNGTSNFTEAGGGGRSVTITNGTIEHFTILTGSGADTITTGAGNDIIRTGHGASTVSAGQGVNTIFGGRNADTITALDGGNLVRAGNGANTVTTGTGADVIYTGTGADTIVAGGGNDRIYLSGGADSLDAGAGHDRSVIDYSEMTTKVTGGITGGNGKTGYVGHLADTVGNSVNFTGVEAFTITTGKGNDNVRTGTHNDILKGAGGNDTLAGGGGADKIFGNPGDDLLKGNGGNDTLSGGVGQDTLIGGAGSDRLTGGFGADHFVFLRAGESRAGPGRDVITDFTSGVDKIDLSALNADLSFIGTSAFGGVAGQVRFATPLGIVSVDLDGDGTADFSVLLRGVGSLSGQDFLL